MTLPRTLLAATIASAILVAFASVGAPANASGYDRVPAARLDIANDANREVAVFAGGCFWGVEAVFERVDGVQSAVSGFAGGEVANPSYKQVIRGNTGHAEAVRVVFDPRKVSYAQLLRAYFSVIADPTLKNRQGPDVGEHYRTAFFPQSERQKRVARAYIAQLDKSGTYRRPIVTTIEKGKFYRAEEYHQDFMRKNPRHPYILAHDAPKVRAFDRLFPGLRR
ncbi:peptide-methionine (S)-S-oxide reductase MsrA [Sphingomicrobium clamense]|uniref:Peptide methionine sulfoxide reductase MsrA n=1 Tax=Sphingomicrobium clamense TaxID=2851013 RepID=A0ABS6V6L8_9SPHN|nr:peptide-methionine (S)-S-oxide reductase MsrA [Sphingomicrobium sp. B8]MBW0145173.1 peptide-methionine (S)-S-oxide reductase MsrA [Sphingomicrobium sp. B8]